MTRRAPRVLLVGSLPLSAPWNGSDKNLARALVGADRASRYTLLTGPADAWGSHVTPVVVERPGTAPGAREWLRATRFAVSNVRGQDLLHVLATLRSANPLASAALRTVGRVAGIPIVHTVPSIGDADPVRRHFVGDATIVFSRHTADRLAAAGVPRIVRMFPPAGPRRRPRRGRGWDRPCEARSWVARRPVRDPCRPGQRHRPTGGRAGEPRCRPCRRPPRGGAAGEARSVARHGAGTHPRSREGGRGRGPAPADGRCDRHARAHPGLCRHRAGARDALGQDGPADGPAGVACTGTTGRRHGSGPHERGRAGWRL